MRNNAVPTMLRLLLTLRYLATGIYLIAAGHFSGVSASTACQIITSVTDAIARLRPMHVKFPNNMADVIQNFYNIARFPRVIGAIDCTHVDIISPGGDRAECYRNGRRKFFSINVQVVCDSSLKIMDIVARWPGSCYDQTIFNNSHIKQRLEMGQFGDGIILGDSGYENKPYLFTPFLNPNCAAQNLFNESQIRTRNVVERCFGVLKNMFPVLRKKITLSLPKTQQIIVACAVLHNIAIEAKEEDFGVYTEALNPEQQQMQQEIARVNARGGLQGDPRRHLVNDYFVQLLGQHNN